MGDLQLDIDSLWAATLQQVVGQAAHEVKDAMNGVSLNLEVLRSRLSAGKDAKSLEPFASAAAQQFETLAARTEAILYLARPPRSDARADLGVTLKHLAVLLVPAAKADGITLAIEGYHTSTPTPTSPLAVRLALAAGLLALIKEGGVGRCTLEAGSETVVRFSHESADVGDLDLGVASALGNENIRITRSDNDLQMVFPGNT